MLISVRVTNGLLTPMGEREVFPLVADALLQVHGPSGNRFMTPNVTGHVVDAEVKQGFVRG